MSPQELDTHAADILHHCDATGIQPENAAAFIQALQNRLLSIHQWLPPVLGTEGYGDGQLTDLMRQAKFQSENVMRNFPNGMPLFTAALANFRHYLQSHYDVRQEEYLHVRQAKSA